MPILQNSAKILPMEYHRIHSDHAIYFLTFTVVKWLPVFTSIEACLIITNSLNYCHQHKGLRINAYVIMSTHLHLILFNKDFDVSRLQQTINDLRKYTGRQLADYCDHNLPQAFQSTLQASSRSDRKRHFWQQSKRPIAIWSEPFWRTKFIYIHENPCRSKLAQEATDWRFSSAAYWLLDPPGNSDVKLSGIQWL